MEWIETTGSTVDEAKDRALDRLGIAEDDMEYEVLEEGSNSLFRIKRKDARLKARVKPISAKPKFDRRNRNRKQNNDQRKRKSTEKSSNTNKEINKNANSKKSNKNSGEASTSNRKEVKNQSDNRKSKVLNDAEGSKKRDTKGKSSKQKKPFDSKAVLNGDNKNVEIKKMNLETQAEITEEFVKGILDRMGLESRVVTSIEEDRAVVQAQGLNLGLAIGPRGETVRAITQLAHTMIQRMSDGEAEGSITVDIGGYRERRRSFLAEFAAGQAEEVLKDGLACSLDPMNASDRKVVHDAVSEIDGVTTKSEGSDYDRYVVILIDG